MITPEERQLIIDDEHLKILSVGFVVSGCMSALFSLLGLLYAGMGIFVFTIAEAVEKNSPKPGQAPPPEIAWIFGIFGLIFFLVLAALALCKFKAASSIRQRKARTFCMVVAGVSCLGIPYGTILGVFSFMVLGRPSVARLFDAPQAT